MDGRARKGSDARGSIGDIESNVEPVDETESKKLRGAPASLRKKGLGIGLLVMIIGFVIWFWPHFNF